MINETYATFICPSRDNQVMVKDLFGLYFLSRPVFTENKGMAVGLANSLFDILGDKIKLEALHMPAGIFNLLEIMSEIREEIEDEEDDEDYDEDDEDYDEEDEE